MFEGFEWEVEVEEGQNPDDAAREARARIFALHKEFNPHLDHSTKPMVQPDGSLPVISVEKSSDQGDDIFENDKSALRAFEYREEAAAYLATSAFSHNVILKAIVNSKPPKA